AFSCVAFEPPNSGVIVMSSRVHYAIPNVIVRKVDSLAVASKCKLENSHTGKAKIISQSFHIRSDHAQVFCDYRHITQRLSESGKEPPSRYVHPLAMFGRLVLARPLPTRGEAAKMIY